MKSTFIQYRHGYFISESREKPILPRKIGQNTAKW
jgi:hypothetical protein